MGPNACTALGRRLVSVSLRTAHHSIMQWLTRLNAHTQDPRLIKLLQRLASTTV
jgi:hypothetical protein